MMEEELMSVEVEGVSVIIGITSKGTYPDLGQAALGLPGRLLRRAS